MTRTEILYQDWMRERSEFDAAQRAHKLEGDFLAIWGADIIERGAILERRLEREQNLWEEKNHGEDEELQV